MANFLKYLPIKHQAIWLPTAIKKNTIVKIIESFTKFSWELMNIEIAARAIIILFGLMNWKKKVFRKVTGFGLTCFDLISEKEIL